MAEGNKEIVEAILENDVKSIRLLGDKQVVYSHELSYHIYQGLYLYFSDNNYLAYSYNSELRSPSFA